ncbi:hypothetical protein [Streptosporangium sp. NBC_01469]|uniref:hypothetical protein n=1 Tax=Streptosporangium sp. NBC_01469 TaxID=2903898 RepID=UPI002E2C7739|nr:hypothetical protein [Streptosporangium sp. NBC_01469]
MAGGLQRVIVAFLVAGGMASVTGSGVLGASGPAPNPDFSLTVSPARLAVGPEGIDDPQSFRVANRGRSPLDVAVGRANFTVDGTGRTAFERAAPGSAAGWLRVTPAGFRLAPGAERGVTVRIDPPPRPEPGGYQVALLFAVPADSGEGNLRVNRVIGTPIYLTLPGAIDTSLRVDDLTTSSGFATGGPIDFTATVDNTGTVHRDFLAPRGLKVVVNGYDVPFPDFTLPRRVGRTVTARWENPPFMCVCRATVSVSGTGGTSTRSATLVILPLHFLGALLAVAVALYVLAWLLRRRFRTRVPGAHRASRGRDDPARQGGEGDGDPVGDGREDSARVAAARPDEV